MKKQNQNGFTLLEILLVVAMIAILAGIVILAINPSKQLADTRNSQRRMDVNTILNAVYQYSVDKNALPTTIPTTTATEICQLGGTCTGLVDLSVLTVSSTYIVSIPSDPSSSTVNSTGYKIQKTVDGRITVTAPYAERMTGTSTISITR